MNRLLKCNIKKFPHITDPDKGRYKVLGIHHSLDMWHGAKNLAKRIAAVSISGSCYFPHIQHRGTSKVFNDVRSIFIPVKDFF